MSYAFNLSQFANNVDSTGKASLTTGVTGTLPIANGGTNKSSLATNSLLATTTVSGSTQITELTGTSGKIVQHNGTNWTAQDPVGGINGYQIYTTTTSWAVPSGITKAFVWVFGGGGGSTSTGGIAGNGAYAAGYVTGLSGTITITVGAGSSTNTAGGTSSFGSYITCTGGASWGSGGANGTATLAGGVMRLRAYCGLETIPMQVTISGSSGYANFYNNQSGLTSGIGQTTYSNTGAYYLQPGLGGWAFNSLNNSKNGIGGAVVVQW